jgi:UDP-glucose 4-epimerase
MFVGRMARHLILGGTGFVGRQAALALMRSGEQVCVTSRSPGKVSETLQGHSELRGQVLDIKNADWDSLLPDYDVIHHYAWSSIPQTAAEDPVADVDGHIRPTLALLNAAKRCGGKRVIFLSSGGTVYGALPSGLADEADYPKPLTIYGATKLAVENYLRVYHAAGDVECLVGRLSNPYGYGQSLDRNQGLVTTFVTKAMRREPLSIWGDGNVVRDYIYISDVTKALTLLASCPIAGRRSELPIYNIASGVGVSVNKVVEIIEQHLGRSLIVTRTPSRPIDLPISILSVANTERALAWKAEVSLDEGIGLMLRQYSDANP